MGVRSRWGFGGRKQSVSSGENEPQSGAATPERSESRELSKTPSRLMRSLTGGFRSSKPKSNKETADEARLNRPFTQQNLEHQKMLGAFAFEFGKRKLSHGGRSSMSGVSPGASRNASVDSSEMPLPHNGERRDTHTRFDSALTRDAPQEVPGEE
ncbi:hypothetical protein BX600DRAFT_221807 [Xylariales sp. PMI_506]|nr:hypothetical protein BX600DRAFT_221807 [Xylariales sp. PMI_506]